MQDKVEADTDIISERGIGNPLMNMTCAAITTALLQEGDTIYGYRLGELRLQGALAGIYIFLNDHFNILLIQICAWGERQVNACKTICPPICNDSLRRIFELKAVYEIGKG